MTPTLGAVLCADEIRALCETAEPLISDHSDQHLQGAKYDLRMADTGMVLPSGKVVLPTSDTPHRSLILLEPGETIFVSTRERLSMPDNLVGNMSIKGDLSRLGVLSLTGLIVDPGYSRGPSEDGRLHFRLANLGAEPVALKPGETSIASIQFLPLAQSTDPPPPVPNVWKTPEELKKGLGFVDDLRGLKLDVERLRGDFESQRRSVEIVVAAGIGLILATLLGVATSALLSLGANSDLVRAAKNVIPNDGRGQWLFVIGLFGLAAIAWATVIGWSQGRRPREAIPIGHRRSESEAVRDLEIARARWLWFGVVLAALLTWTVVALTMEFLNPPTAVDVIVGVVVGAGLAIGVSFLWQPIKEAEVKKRLTSWYEEAA